MAKYTKKSRGRKYRSRKYRGGDNNIVVTQSEMQDAITTTQTLLNKLNEIESNNIIKSDKYGLDSQFSPTSNDTSSPSTSTTFTDENYKNDLTNLNSVDPVPISYDIDSTFSDSTSPSDSTSTPTNDVANDINSYQSNVKLQPEAVITTYNGNDITLGQIKSQLYKKMNMQNGRYANKYKPVLNDVNSATSAADVLKAIKYVYKNGIISGGKTKKRINGRKTRRY
jgi:hypothetical protein